MPVKKQAATKKTADQDKQLADKLTAPVGKSAPAAQAKEPAKRGKRAVQFDLVIVEQMAAAGLTEQQIADAHGVSRTCLNEHKRKEPELVEAIQRGRGKGIYAVANVIYKAAIDDKNIKAAVEFMKYRGGWVETKRLEHSSPDGSMTPQQVFTGASVQAVRALLKAERDGDAIM